MKKSFSRRNFITTGLMGVSGLALANGSPFMLFNNTDKIRVGLIGAGQRGLGIASVIKNTRGLEIGACCDIVQENLNEGMKLAAPNGKAYTNYQKLLQDKTIDAVAIATPLYLHYQMAMDAISAGKHVYLEKTMTYDIQQALSLHKAASARPNQVVQIGHQYRYYDMYYKIKSMLDKNIIGKITHFESQYNRNSDWRRPVKNLKMEKQINWRLYKEFSGGVLAELSSHQIDIVNWLTNSHPNKVIAMGDVNYWKDGRTTFDNVRAVYEYPGGIKSSIVSLLSNEFNGYMVRILGSDGTIEMGRDTAKLYLEPKKKELGMVDGVTGATKEALEKGKSVEIYSDTEGIEPTYYAMVAFEDCIRNKKKPFCNTQTGKDVAIAVHLGNKATETGNTEFWKPGF